MARDPSTALRSPQDDSVEKRRFNPQSEIRNPRLKDRGGGSVKTSRPGGVGEMADAPISRGVRCVLLKLSRSGFADFLNGGQKETDAVRINHLGADRVVRRKSGRHCSTTFRRG